MLSEIIETSGSAPVADGLRIIRKEKTWWEKVMSSVRTSDVAERKGRAQGHLRHSPDLQLKFNLAIIHLM